MRYGVSTPPLLRDHQGQEGGKAFYVSEMEDVWVFLDSFQPYADTIYLCINPQPQQIRLVDAISLH